LFGNILGHYIVYRTFSQEGNAWNLWTFYRAHCTQDPHSVSEWGSCAQRQAAAML